MGHTIPVPERLDRTFAALADPTRREILALLARGETSVMDLAGHFSVSQPAISRHLKVLERALAEATDWLESYRQFWESRYQKLDEVLEELKSMQTRGDQVE
jgi:DNA-binding transcriptional ArsR family regulator